MARLTRKALVLAKVQPMDGVDAAPDAATDAILVSDPEYSVDPEILEREFVSPTLSPNPLLVGRKMAMLKFTTEVRGNGIQHSGDADDVCKLGVLLRGSGFELTGYDGTTPFAFVVPDFENDPGDPEVTFVHAGPTTLTRPVVYTITISTGGASATAAATITSNSADDTPNAAPVTLTSGEDVPLGTKGGTVTLTWEGELAVGQRWRVLVSSPGTVATLVSEDEDMEKLTLHYYQDGVKHPIIDAQGTVQVRNEAGKFGTMEWTFTGKYVTPTDTAFPDPSTIKYEEIIPPKVEYANLTYQSNKDLIVGDFSFETGNDITPRPDVNSEDGFHGVRLTARKPIGGFTPEAVLEGTVAFWQDMASSKRRFFYGKVGTVPGNMVAFVAPSAQTNRLGYGDRDGLATYDVGLAFSGYKGDDELTFLLL